MQNLGHSSISQARLGLDTEQEISKPIQAQLIIPSFLSRVMLIVAFVFVPQTTHVFREHGVPPEPRESPFTLHNNFLIEAFCIEIPEWRNQV